MRLSHVALFGVVLTAAFSNSFAADVGTAFTYQGTLEKPPGTPLNDACAFQFMLCDDADAACAPGTVSSQPAIVVSEGVFAVDVDFGAQAFNGQGRWMGISIQCPGDASFVSLSPRVELKPAPYSFRAMEGVGPPNAIDVDSATGEVGIGTSGPVCKLHVAGGDACNEGGYNFVEPGEDEADAAFYRGGTGFGIFRRFVDSHTIFQVWAPPESKDSSSKEATLALVRGDEPNVEYIDVYNNGYAQETQYGIRMQKRGTGEFRDFVFDYSDGVSPKSEVMRLTPSGNVGIGTNAPETKLDVNGAARATTIEITGGILPPPNAVGWGENVFGEASPPFDTAILAAGVSYSVAIRSDGTLTAWGSGGNGELNVPSGTFVALAAGHYHAFALGSDGTLFGWGWNAYGQTNIPSGTFIAAAGGITHSLAIRSDGTLVGWGENTYGEIDVPAGTFVAVAAGSTHSIGLRSDGTLAGWGINVDGQINVPVGTFTAISTFNDHCLAIRTDGTLAAWGKNDSGQINAPVGTFVAVAAGNSHSIALRADGTLVGWGANNSGQIDVPIGTFSAIATGQSHGLAIQSDATPAVPGLRLLVDSAFKPGTNTWTIYSDRRLKKDITPLSGALDHLLQLRGVTFNWRDPVSQGGITGTQMGLIADEVQRVFPQWVGRDPKGYQTLTVGGFEALTAEALRELREEKNRQLSEKDCEIDALNSEISNFKFEISDLKEAVRALTETQKHQNAEPRK